MDRLGARQRVHEAHHAEECASQNAESQVQVSRLSLFDSVGYDLKSNDLKSRFEIKFLNCDFDIKSFSNK